MSREPEEEYTRESWWSIRRRLLKLWPGVSAERVHMVLRAASESGTPGVQPLLERAIELGGKEAADLLMVPVADTFPFPDYRDRPSTVLALNALIRAGGDPTPALPALAQALGDRHCAAGAIGTLRRAAIAGFDLEPLRAVLEATDDDSGELHTVRRLAFMERPDRKDTLARLAQVYANQRVANLREGIGLVEELLGSPEPATRDVGDSVLAGLLAAERDLYRCWIALLPALRHFLARGTATQRRQALRALDQFRYTPKYAVGLTKRQASKQALPTLTALLVDVAPLLATDAAGEAAAVILQFTELGAAAEGVVEALNQALTHADDQVRSACSQALSLHLARTGAEETLPKGVSWRRSFATTDDPLRPAEKPARCARCGELAARTIYEHNDGAQFYSTTTWETRCAACGVYAVHVFQAPG
ncbi:MAG: hypothetical protein KC486_35560 [Myxococcales bacterium]|nr:hypothetical protein [Myxococcales bacterium]